MKDCEHLPQCPFFHDKMGSMPALAFVYKKQYCQTDCSSCARYLVATALGPKAVPTDLYPTQVERAKSLINAQAA